MATDITIGVEAKGELQDRINNLKAKIGEYKVRRLGLVDELTQVDQGLAAAQVALADLQKVHDAIPLTIIEKEEGRQ